MQSGMQIGKLINEANWDRPVLVVAAFFALLSTSCCVLPIGLAVLGFGGSWLAFLGPFVAYRSLILTAIGLVLIVAWGRLLFRRNPCVRRKASTVFLTSASTALFITALSAPLWEQEAARAMWTYWTERS